MRIRVRKGSVRLGRPPHTETIIKGAVRVVPDEIGEDLVQRGVAEQVRKATNLGLDANAIRGNEDKSA